LLLLVYPSHSHNFKVQSVKGMLDRRKHKRFQVQDDALAVLRPSADKRGLIIDISMEGLAFGYIAGKGSLDLSSRLDIWSINLSFRLFDIPIRIVSDSELTSEFPFWSMKRRRCSVQFLKPSQEQTSQLGLFIQNHARGLATNKPTEI
jgi:hypothetical protein